MKKNCQYKIVFYGTNGTIIVFLGFKIPSGYYLVLVVDNRSGLDTFFIGGYPGGNLFRVIA